MGEIRIALGFLAITFLAGITSAQSLSANAPVNLTTGKSASIQKGGAQGGIQQNADSLSTIKAMLGQKIILDFRYFCEDDTPSSQCRTPMTKIPASLLALLSSHNIGGVILFSENIENTEQLITLNYTMQQHMLKVGKQPLFIAIDQEGGRVARLPSDMSRGPIGLT